MHRAIDLAERLGAKALVFGSPKNRVRGSLLTKAAHEIAVDFFRPIGEYAAERGCRVCIEPNPPAYGCDFVTTTPEAIELCRAIDHPGIAINLDLGTIAMNGESPRAVIEAAATLIGHVHISEPELVAPSPSSLHDEAARALERIGYERWVSIEMRAAGGGKNIDTVERAIGVARSAYGPPRA
jgi:sugar phosphate isomerase/epimerase